MTRLYNIIKEIDEGKDCNICSWKGVDIGGVAMCEMIEKEMSERQELDGNHADGYVI